MNVVVLANGETPVGLPADLLRAADFLVACDGAWQRACACGREPDLVVGDGDSLEADHLDRLGCEYVRIAEQETNDLAKAIRVIRERFGSSNLSVTLIGAGGGREDHLIGNVFRLPLFARDFPDIICVTNAGRFDVVLPGAARTFSSQPGAAVSVFATEPLTHVVSKGLVWPLAGVDLAPLWSGTLNRCEGDAFVLETDKPLLVYRPR